MLRLRTFIILIVIYLIAFISIKFNLNLFYPYDLARNYLLMPVIAIASNKDLKNTSLYNETLITSLKEEINSLKELNNIKTVLADYQKINATVIERNRNYWFNAITIDKGLDDGILKDMAVIDSNGLIGKISHVSKNMSEIKLITSSDINNKTSVLIESNGEKIYGIIDNYNDDYLEVRLTSKKNKIEAGLKVVTTGMGGIYPSGVLIGETVGVKDSKYDVGIIVLVKPVANFNNLKYVAVLKRN